MNDFFKNMMDAQQSMMNSWQEMYQNTTRANDNPYTKVMSEYFDMQKKYMDALTSKTPFDASAMFADYFKAPGFDPKSFEFFTNMQKMYLEQMQKFTGTMNPMGFGQTAWGDLSKMMDISQWTEGAGNMNKFLQQLQKLYNPLETGKLFDPAVKDLLEKVMNANTYYLNLYKLWKDVENTQIKPSIENMQKYAMDMAKKYDTVFNDMVIPMVPAEFRGFIKDPAELIKTYIKTSTDFYAPWMDNAEELRDLFTEGIFSDKSKLAEFFELWKAQFDKTFGALLLSPVVGANKDIMEQQNKAFDTFLNLGILGMDFTTRITAIQNENMGSIIEKYFKLAEEGIQPRTFREFYDYWSGQIEKVFDSYFATEEYSKLLSEVSAAAMDYRIETHKLIEKYLVDTPIVTRTEIDSLYKTVYELKKTVKAMKKQQEKDEKDKQDKQPEK